MINSEQFWYPDPLHSSKIKKLEGGGLGGLQNGTKPRFCCPIQYFEKIFRKTKSCLSRFFWKLCVWFFFHLLRSVHFYIYTFWDHIMKRTIKDSDAHKCTFPINILIGNDYRGKFVSRSIRLKQILGMWLESTVYELRRNLKHLHCDFKEAEIKAKFRAEAFE